MIGLSVINLALLASLKVPTGFLVFLAQWVLFLLLAASQYVSTAPSVHLTTRLDRLLVVPVQKVLINLTPGRPIVSLVHLVDSFRLKEAMTANPANLQVIQLFRVLQCVCLALLALLKI
jgi:hypothetical protein